MNSSLTNHISMKRSYLAIAMLATLTSCFSPKPVFRFKTEETQTTWDKGKEYVSYKKGEYEVHTSYYGNDENNIMFDIEIVNSNGDEFLVAPESIIMYTGSWDNATQSIAYNTLPIRAIDPEMELLKIDLERSRAEAANKNAGVAAVAIFAAAIPLAVVAAKSDAKNSNSTENKISNTDLVNAGVDVAFGVNAINQEIQLNKMAAMQDSKYNWEVTSLRKTTLSPGYSIRGLVSFPIPDKNFNKIRLDVPTPDGYVNIKYDYLIFYPNY